MRLQNLRHPSDYDVLSEIHRAQLDRISTLYDGGVVSGRQRLVQDGSETSFAGMIELWDLVEDDQVRYEFWHYVVDSGTIFIANTTQVLAEVGQGHLCPIEDKVFMRAFRDAVQAAKGGFPDRKNPWPEVRLED